MPGRAAICDLDFAVHAGDTIALLGPNGGGKTTALRALLGEIPYRSGDVRIAPAAYVPQSMRSRLDFPVNALDVALMGTYASTSWHQRIGPAQRQVAEQTLERVGMLEHARSMFGELSGGQRQRVLIARALAQEADVILMDEPLSGVDRPSSERILDLLDELAADGRAIVVSMHDVNTARRFKRVLCVHGRQVFYGPPERLNSKVLEETYGGEIVVLEDDRRAVLVHHHHH